MRARVTLDLEHAAVDWSQAAVIFALVAEAGCVPLARVPEGDHYCIKRALDAGAFGIVVPMVNTVQQAITAIAAAKYPPLGNRSVGGGMHSLNFAASVGDYYERASTRAEWTSPSESQVPNVAWPARSFCLTGLVFMLGFRRDTL